ncbi:lipoprotein [Paenibacillus camelliae]|uniref:lipoprotein n=1 Tax=Paenibacillus camelliae TaxID=512410 RepID=UPI002040220A|nr:lipoprotein [Paenibacillus camelliae]MCM3635072.1 lipoprotein [Paenibacillus camelliae]
MKKITVTIAILILLALTACNTKDSSYTAPDGKEYKYKLELTGMMPNASKESKYIILTNDITLTFDKVAKSIYSSNSKDSDGFDYYLLLTE